MPASTPTDTQRCPDCGGFGTAAVTTGHHYPDGTRATIPVDCPACWGFGHTPARLGIHTPAAALAAR